MDALALPGGGASTADATRPLTRLAVVLHHLAGRDEVAMTDDRAFYERRLREELDRAGTSPDNSLRSLHQRWANLYQMRLDKLRSRKHADRA